MKQFSLYFLALCITLAISGCAARPAAPDYSTDMQLWMYTPKTISAAAGWLTEIGNCRYGSAGASLSQASAAASLLQLSKQEDLPDILKAHFDGMDATQLDYFSFQWQMRFPQACSMVQNPEAYLLLLEESGCPDIHPADYSMEELTTLDQLVRQELARRNVSDSWKNHLDREPFFLWQEESPS